MATDLEALSSRVHLLAERLGHDLAKLAAVVEPHAGEEPEIGRLVLSMLSTLGRLVHVADEVHQHGKGQAVTQIEKDRTP